TFSFNTSNAAVNNTFGGVTISVPAGPFFGFSLTLDAAHPLTITALGPHYTLSGTFLLEQVNGQFIIAATNVASTATIGGGFNVDITNGNAAFIITGTGVVGTVSAKVGVGATGIFSAGADVAVTF